MRTCSCGARAPISSSSPGSTSAIGADSGLSSTGAGASAALQAQWQTSRWKQVQPGSDLAARTCVELGDQFFRHRDGLTRTDARDHRVQAVEAAFQ